MSSQEAVVQQDKAVPVFSIWGEKSDGKVRIFKGGVASDVSTVDEADH